MNSYRVIIKHYSGVWTYYYIKAMNKVEAFRKAHKFICQYDGVREIATDRIKASDVREYTDEKAAQEAAWRRNAQGNKTEQMNEALQKVKDIARITRPEKDVNIVYVRVTAEHIEAFSDWDIQRFGIHIGDERILIGTPAEGLLYTINVTGDSVMQSIAELTDLLAGKGW